MQVALVGLFQSGKSTILSAVSGKEVPTGSTSISEQIVPVPDERLDLLAHLHKPTKQIYATVDCLDLPGFDFTAEHGRAAARRLINQVRTVDLLVLVVRAFDDPEVPAYRDRVDPAADLVELQTELLLADLELVATRIERLEKQVHKPTQTQARDKAELAIHKKLQEAIEAEQPVRSVIQTDAQRDLIKSLGLLTLKPMAVAVNVGEEDIRRTLEFGDVLADDVPVFSFSAKLEKELAQLDSDSRAEFMSDLGIIEPGVTRFVRGCYSALGMISFLTVGKDEVRAWPIREGTVALEAAGKVHTDIQRGFIRAETIAYEDLKELGDEKAVKAAGRVRLEGKEYIVQDGDVVNFRFNV